MRPCRITCQPLFVSRHIACCAQKRHMPGRNRFVDSLPLLLSIPDCDSRWPTTKHSLHFVSILSIADVAVEEHPSRELTAISLLLHPLPSLHTNYNQFVA